MGDMARAERAIYVLLGDRHPIARRAIDVTVVCRAVDLADGLAAVNHVVHRVRDASVSVGRGVLVDQRCAHGAVPHPVHQLARRGADIGGELVAGVPQVVEVEATR